MALKQMHCLDVCVGMVFLECILELHTKTKWQSSPNFYSVAKVPVFSIVITKQICEDCAYICPSIVDKINDNKKVVRIRTEDIFIHNSAHDFFSVAS